MLDMKNRFHNDKASNNHLWDGLQNTSHPINYEGSVIQRHSAPDTKLKAVFDTNFGCNW